MEIHGTASVLEIVWTVVAVAGVPRCLQLIRFWLSRKRCDYIDWEIVRGHLYRKLGYLGAHLLAIALGVGAMDTPPRHDASGLSLIGGAFVIYVLLGMEVDMFVSLRRYRRIDAARGKSTP